MEFFDKLGKKASEAYKMTADKTGKIAKETKMKFKIGELRSQINDIYEEIGKKVYEKHREWLSFSWPKYTAQAHIGLAMMYVADERFAKYYNDRAGEEATQVLHDCIVKYAK